LSGNANRSVRGGLVLRTTRRSAPLGFPKPSAGKIVTSRDLEDFAVKKRGGASQVLTRKVNKNWGAAVDRLLTFASRRTDAPQAGIAVGLHKATRQELGAFGPAIGAVRLTPEILA